MLVAARPILPSSGEGPHAGTFIMGRLLDEDLVNQLNAMTSISFTFLDVTSADHDAQTALAALLAGDQVFLSEAEQGSLGVFGLLRDLHGAPALLIRAVVSREISQTGSKALLTAIGGIIVAGLIVMAATVGLLQVALVGPLRHLTRHLLAVGDSGDLARRLALKRKDEIGTLSREFDEMLGKLAETRNRLLDQSYSAGIAEMASGVLHNIRNQLAPLSLRLERLQDSLNHSSGSNLARAIMELKSSATAPERKQKML